jgi:nucleotide-binding universal stress UspA family protein
MESNIVIGVDGTTPSWDALYWAVREAHRRLSPLHLVFVAPDSRADPVSASEKLAHMVADARQLEPAVRVTGSLADGDATSALCAASCGAALLVVGDTAEDAGRTPLGRAGQQAATRIPVPVVVVREATPDSAPVPARAWPQRVLAHR